MTITKLPDRAIQKPFENELDLNSTLKLKDVIEKLTVNTSAMGANIQFDFLENSILYHTANSTANCTINFRGNSTVTLNEFLSANQAVSAAALITNGATGYVISNIQIDGNTVTPKLSGNTTPVANTNAVDLYSYTILKTADNVFTVFSGKTEFV